MRGKRRKRSDTAQPLAVVRVWKEDSDPLRDLVMTAVAHGQRSAHALWRWRSQLEHVLLCAEPKTFLRALGSSVAAIGAAGRPAAVTPLQKEGKCVYSSFSSSRSTKRERQRL